jgi:1-acyl-sn-glycerol-3-phosphate acyltransferase
LRRVPLLVAGDTWFYRFARFVFAVLTTVAYRYKAEGAEHLPSTGPALVAVNHKSDLDPVLAGIAFGRQSCYFAKAELFDNRFFGRAVSELGAIPVHRGAGDRAAIETALAILERGDVLVLFPEGTRYGDDEIHTFQRGVGFLALRSGAPVIPMAIKGSAGISFGLRPRLARIRAKVGAPVDLSGLEGRRSPVYAEAAGRIEGDVRRLYELL